ncbi:TnsA-like heteromeric transposase endonuclease subunit [Streptomyces noursei]|uniref:TnsA-like heteromeric transposase endonuclease subunit n=1 Tax=Streptomyces noursei TaxID=1971 RepID=UPI001F0407B8|nr:TnsA-like heteromeric transposase endonuclease subunit [Streptomyces noursei]
MSAVSLMLLCPSRLDTWRRVRSAPGMAHYSSDYVSATAVGQVVYESRLELARLPLADFDPSVCRICAQPLRMVTRIDGKVRSHVPDFLLVMSSGTVRVVNVKPASRLQDPKVAQALAWPGDLIERHGWEYETWPDAEPTLLEKIRFLAAYRHPGIVPSDDVERAWQEVVDGEELALAERRPAGDRKPEEARPPLMALLWEGRLTTDLSARPLSGRVCSAEAWINRWTETSRPGLPIAFDGEQFTVAEIEGRRLVLRQSAVAGPPKLRQVDICVLLAHPTTPPGPFRRLGSGRRHVRRQRTADIALAPAHHAVQRTSGAPAEQQGDLPGSRRHSRVRSVADQRPAPDLSVRRSPGRTPAVRHDRAFRVRAR